MHSVASRLGLSGSDVTLTLIFIGGFIALTIASGGNLLSHQSLLSFFTYLCVPILIGLSQMVTLAVGQLNLAIGAMGGAVSGLMAVAMVDLGVPTWLGLLIGMAAATIIGAINGILIIVTGLNGFIVTLGTMTVLLGVQYALVGTRIFDTYSSALKSFGRVNWFGVPLVFLITLAVALCLSIFFKRSVPGRRILATGGSSKAALLSGISNSASIVLAFTVSGILIGVAAIVTLTTLPGVNRSIGGDWLLASFAAPIIGGALLTGGASIVYGTIVAAMVLRLVDVVRVELALDPSWTNFVIGGVVLVTVAIGEFRKRRTATRLLIGSRKAALA